MLENRTSTERLLGWIYVAVLTSIVIFASLSGDDWSTRQEVIFGGLLSIFISGGFLLARYLYQDSAVFRLFYRFGKLQTSGGSLRDKCLMNCCIFGLLGIVLVLLALFNT